MTAPLALAGIAPADVAFQEQLTDGFYNTLYRLEMVDGARQVLKVEPSPNQPRLDYEIALLATEELFLRVAETGGVPVPRVIRGDEGYLLMEEVPGQTWHSLRAELAEADQARLRAELGRVVADLHRLTGRRFGYSQRGLASTWREAFLGMVDAVLADAARFGVQLPEIRSRVTAAAPLLDDVVTPALVHFDLWPGNIMLDAPRGTLHISALIDGERSFWGDPLADMASLALFGDIEQDEAFLTGYRQAGGVLVFDDTTRARIALYQVYLYAIMLVEAVPRKRAAAAQTGEALDRALAALG
ncbi:aminoglycoside phosphotransferase family protein [Allokutzneria sp. A3M-2-11 16]|uniref:phosphotransferase family protein n=1 Tax=Allokutzneria sp. A3M-2-11 16 TaxID=2962043 RepID=UPI0020B86E56|nr:aminoglycoside phosphotransferase family protein [Allokutzneria sp. A3M-2-11 16]MCP3803792.1 aminoglycoside phosphotransferase family protein [Allokutzneria sp. A3M-2-11 16]